jgi:hypothetical protein
MLATAMRPWRVTVVDGLFHRYQGFGIVLAASEDEARAAVTEYLKHNTAYGKPFEVSDVDPHDHPEPHVLFYEWGEPFEWPRKYDDCDLDPRDPAMARAVGPCRFTAPDGQVFFGKRVGRLFVFWPEGDEDDRDEAYWDPNDRHFALVALAETLGFRIGRDEFPPWLNALETQVVHDLWEDPDTP